MVRKKRSTLSTVKEDFIKWTFYSEHKRDSEVEPYITNFKAIVPLGLSQPRSLIPERGSYYLEAWDTQREKWGSQNLVAWIGS